MSLKVVLDKKTLFDAFTNDSYGVKSTLIKICDQIVINKNILNKYGNISAVSPYMEILKEMKPKPKIISPKMKPLPDIPIPSRTHVRLVKGAISSEADILIMSAEIRGKWIDLEQELKKQYKLKILTPEQYVDQRKKE
jgi:hypothetical protein